MTPRVAFFDIAGTIVTTEPWSYMMRDARLSPYKRGVLLQMMPLWFGKRIKLVGDYRYRDRWVRLMAGLLKGWSRQDTQTLFTWVVRDQMKEAFHPALLKRIQEHKDNGDQVVLISGVFDQFGAVFAQQVGADTAIGSKLGYRDEVCLGTIEGKTCAETVKLEMLRTYLTDAGFSSDLSQHYAYADSASDLPMLTAVGTPIAVYPDDLLQMQARTRGWQIIQ
ncbi:MAG: HAD-IB family hydrolase [Anaerolineae bacterium]|jgi:HAD superfamily hydrolase (TIGR01490 family)|nr:HAD-IB family hydrolase [Anaerolineae bacterium]